MGAKQELTELKQVLEGSANCSLRKAALDEAMTVNSLDMSSFATWLTNTADNSVFIFSKHRIYQTLNVTFVKLKSGDVLIEVVK